MVLFQEKNKTLCFLQLVPLLGQFKGPVKNLHFLRPCHFLHFCSLTASPKFINKCVGSCVVLAKHKGDYIILTASHSRSMYYVQGLP